MGLALPSLMDRPRIRYVNQSEMRAHVSRPSSFKTNAGGVMQQHGMKKSRNFKGRKNKNGRGKSR
jgi:hypothetical protein